MSTKIYEGFEILGLDTTQLFTELEALGQELRILAKQEYAAWFIQTLVKNLDRKAWRTRTGKESDSILPFEFPTSYAGMMTHRAAAIRKMEEHIRDPEQDWDFALCFVPAGEQRWLAIPFTEKESMLAVLRNKPWYRPYGYWNNTDQLEGVSEEEWDMRAKEWEAVMPSFRPTQHMAKFEMVTNRELHYIANAELEPYVPTDAERQERIIRDAAKDEYFYAMGGYSTASDFLDKNEVFNKGFVPGGTLWHLHTEFAPMAEEIVKSNPVERLLER
ncbi:MAG: hypothetical protein JSS66_07125 [Armatimonadetes bacterium]|nr:hypothetical protein [Armatimonadota bacterium]